MNPIEFKEVNVKYAENQDEYQTLPAFKNEEESISCWKFNWLERFKILIHGKLWLRQMNFGESLQPQLPQVETPFLEKSYGYKIG